MRGGFAAAALALVLSLTALGRPVAATDVELLSNGGFEDGTTGWTTSNGTLTTTSEPDPVYTGDNAAAFSVSGPEAGKVRHDAVPVEPGGGYTLTAFILKNDPGVEYVQVSILWYANRDGSGGHVDTDSSTKLLTDDPLYQQVSIVVPQARPDALSARIVFTVIPDSTGGVVYIDDVSFQGPPAPTPAPPTPTAATAAVLTPSPTPMASQAPTTTPIASPTPTATPTPTPPPMPTGRLLNSGFEEASGGILVGWQKYGGTLQQTARHRRSGSFAAAHISDSESTKWVYQPVLVQPDRLYVFEGYVLLNDPGVREAYLRVSWYASDDASGEAIASADSTERLTDSDPSFRYLTTGAMLVPIGARSAKVRVMLAPVSSARATIYLDDMSLSEVSPQMPVGPTAPLAPNAQAPPPEPDEPDPESPAGEGVLSAETLAVVAAGESPYQVKINEVMYDPAQSGDDASYEWLELYNAGGETADLANWTISDNRSSDALPPLSLAPGSFAVVAAGEQFRSVYPAFDGILVVLEDGKIGNGLANRGDRLILRDGSGRLVDALSYSEDEDVLSPPAPAVAPGHSLERSPPGQDTDSAQDLVDNPRPSPGTAIKEAAVSPGTATRSAPSSSRESAIEDSEGGGSSGMGVWVWAIAGAGLLAVGVGLSAAALRWRRAHSRQSRQTPQVD